MGEKVIYYCARCHSRVGETEPYLWLCGDCSTLVFERIREKGIRKFSYQATKVILREYGVDDIDEAYVLKHYGRSPKETVYTCDWCDKRMSSPPPKEARFRIGFGEFNRKEGFRCSFCQKDYERQRRRDEKEEEKDRRELRRLL